MSKPLPNCHYCGRTVARKARIIFDFHGKKFAWHSDDGCSKKDKHFDVACKVFSGKLDENEGCRILCNMKGKKP